MNAIDESQLRYVKLYSFLDYMYISTLFFFFKFSNKGMIKKSTALTGVQDKIPKPHAAKRDLSSRDCIVGLTCKKDVKLN